MTIKAIFSEVSDWFSKAFSTPTPFSDPEVSSASVKTSPAEKIDLNSDSFRKDLGGLAFGDTPVGREEAWFNQSPLLYSPWGLVLGMSGCVFPVPNTGGGPWQESEGQEYVWFIAGGDAIGGGTFGNSRTITVNYERSSCERPVDIDVMPDTDKLMITCGDEGQNQIDILKVSRGSTDSVRYPDYISGGKPEKAINLTASAIGPKGEVYTTFNANDKSAYTGSGILVQKPDQEETVAVLFGQIERQVQTASSKDNASSIVPKFFLNAPRSIMYSNGNLYILTANRSQDASSKEIFYGPATVLHYVVDYSNSTFLQKNSDAAILLQKYNPTAMDILPDGRILVVTRGANNTAPALSIVAKDLSGVETTIPLEGKRDLADPFYFIPSLAAGIKVVRNRYVLIGSTDQSGRIAIVDLGKSPAEVNFLKVFPGDIIAGIVHQPNGEKDCIYVASTWGLIRKVNIDFGKNLFEFGPVARNPHFSQTIFARTAPFKEGIIVAGPHYNYRYLFKDFE